MIVYANSFYLEDKNGIDHVIGEVYRWCARKCANLDYSQFSNGINAYRNDDYLISSKAVKREPESSENPVLFWCALKHSDREYRGRLWKTEIGICQERGLAPILISLSLTLSEKSVRVTAPVVVTRPEIIKFLAQNCQPKFGTPGIEMRTLDETSTEGFMDHVNSSARLSPIVIVSRNRDGNTEVNPNRLLQQLIGLADVYVVSPEADTFALEELLGKNYNVYLGAVNIIYPKRKDSTTAQFSKLLPEQFKDDSNSDAMIKEIMAIITDISNVFHYHRHIDEIKVREQLLHYKTKVLIQAKTSSQDEAALVLLSENEELLNNEKLANEELKAELSSTEALCHSLQLTNDSLKHALDNQSANKSEYNPQTSHNIRSYLYAALYRQDLSACLYAIAELFPERLHILDSAYKSAKKSPFRNSQVALELLFKLASTYWERLSNEGDAAASSVFGDNEYASSESDTLRKEGRKRRTFLYKDKPIMMERHLKHGAKKSDAETLRIHFEWIADENLIVIGHCGKHLPL